MSQPPSSDDATALPPSEPAPSPNDLEAVRELLFGQEKKQLDVLQERIEDPALHARDVSRVLPKAVSLASARDGRLTVALTPAVESALKESVKRDPSILVNAIFPIIGPAIRKAIAETFGKLVQSLNQTLEHSLSARSLKWRLEAARTGKRFSEVVLAHTLVYRVEQVFLIHKQTGLLLQHITAAHIRAEDASMVSGMLTAIQDFAQDSFRVSAGEALHTLQIGELNVWVESSPLVTLASVIRGQAPYEFRTVLQSALEKIHGEQGAALEAFDGDAAPFELARPHLEPCLQAQFAETAKTMPSAKVPVLGGVVVVVVLAAWLGFSIREKRRWADFLERIKAEPGIVVTEAGKRSGKFFVAGLRDPLAVEPASLLPEFKIKPEKMISRWEPYQALSQPLVLKRAEKRLQAPASVTLRVQDGVLFAEGLAPAGWVETARQRALMLPGIHGFNDIALVDEAAATLAAHQRNLEQVVLFFEDGTRLADGQEAAVDAVAAHINELFQVAVHRGRHASISVIGHTDMSGGEELNLRLSRQRADYVVSLLAARGVPTGTLVPTGIGSREQWRADLPDQIKNRRVTFRVAPPETPPGTPAP